MFSIVSKVSRASLLQVREVFCKNCCQIGDCACLSLLFLDVMYWCAVQPHWDDETLWLLEPSFLQQSGPGLPFQ